MGRRSSGNTSRYSNDASLVFNLGNFKYPPIESLFVSRDILANKCSLNGGATWDKSISTVWVCALDGSGWIDCGHVTDFAQVTYLCWVYAVDYTVNYMMMMTRTTGNELELRMTGTTATPAWVINSNIYLGTGYAMTNGMWYLIAATFDSTWAYIYANGNNIIGQAYSPQTINSHPTDHLLIGKRSDGYNWVGKIGLPRAYNRVLSGTEIFDIYNSEKDWFISTP